MKHCLNSPSADRQIAIITDDPGWHGRQLRDAFADRGYQASYLSLTESLLPLSGHHNGVSLPGFEAQLPAGIFVRGVPGGSLEQVILRLDALHIYEHLGILVYNSGRAIERTVDKAMTSFLLRHAGLPTPDTWVCESEQAARACILRETARGHRLVVKPLFGSQGEGIIRIDSADDDRWLGMPGQVFYLQSFIDRQQDLYEDIRVFVVGNQVIGGMRRQSEHWITNRSQGGRCHALIVDQELAELAQAAVTAVDIHYAGVDLIRDAAGKLWITEVNSIPAWWGLQKHVEANIAGLLVDDMLSHMHRAGLSGADVVSALS